MFTLILILPFVTPPVAVSTIAAKQLAVVKQTVVFLYRSNRGTFPIMDAFTAMLEARDPALGRFRAYRLEAGTDLLGGGMVDITYGRIGTRGRRIHYAVQDEAGAKKPVRERLRRGATARKRIGVPYCFCQFIDPHQWFPIALGVNFLAPYSVQSPVTPTMKNDPLSPLRKEVREVQDRHPELSPDNAFVVWFLRAFVVDDEDTALTAIVGGARDKGVDALHIDHENGVVSVIQGKYRQSTNAGSENRSDVLALASLGRALARTEGQEFKALLGEADAAVHTLLEKARDAVQKRAYRLVLYFVTTGKVSNTHREEAVQSLDDWEFVSFEVHARNDLVRRMQDYVEGAAPPVPIISLPIHGEQSFNRFDEETRISSWVFTMLGKDLAKIYENNGIRLFQRNIRGYLGKNDINRGIEYTMEKEPEYFWYFNNGVTIVCDEARQIIDRRQKLLRVSNAQIINGQQTTRTLAVTNAGTCTVLVKVIAVSRDSDEDQRRYSHLVSEIVSATNRQNAIGQVDLKSNDLEQIRLERDLKKLGYRYIRKR